MNVIPQIPVALYLKYKAELLTYTNISKPMMLSNTASREINLKLHVFQIAREN